jgi:hypothetical protein
LKVLFSYAKASTQAAHHNIGIIKNKMVDSRKLEEIQSWITLSLSSDKDDVPIFERVALRMQTRYEQPCASVGELKRRCTKSKGDYFEHLALLYFQHVYGAQQVWLLADLPDELRTRLGLNSNDVGIDIIVQEPDSGDDKSTKYSAVQCKYRHQKPNARRKMSVTWKQLSTFYGLCQRTGPWSRWTVFTSADSVSRKGRKCEKDYTVAYQRLCTLPKSEWMKMANWKGCKMTDQVNGTTVESKQTTPTLEELRQRRLAFYTKSTLA